MKKQKRWIVVPVTTAVVLAMAGCGGQDNNASQASNTSTSAAGGQTQSGSGGADFSNGTEGSGSAAGTDDHSSNSSGDTGTSAGETTNSGAENSLGTQGQSSTNEVVQEVRSQLKLKHAVLPTSFPLEKGKHLAAAIPSNTADAFKVNFYSVDQSVPVNDASLTATNSKAPSMLASFEVKSDKDPDSKGIFPDTDLSNIPEDMSVDLGHGIKGMAEGAAGSQYLTWKEGRWTLQIRSVSEDKMNNPGIAKKMVEYLESHTLPAPKDKGFVNVEYPSGGKTVNVTISWQEGNQIHQLQTDQVPNEALGMVVSVN
ncbi:hypothetical protein [Paenibacillus xylanilyticus]|uniref:Lipoprotein n=1 Tax=Paenibacillus xylanilyticus TaxID=248903 RepID=A0A7Y6BXF0_9BACL|nr:hypothetical protein [Paenibacillus xylanilyticus]NUU76596.1 hypothetical protein [Paenibacillus xylanilyticus]